MLLYLSGGLGNQMFQYAFGRSIAISQNIELALDKYTGFLIDRTYKRKFELGRFNLRVSQIHICQLFPFWLYKLSPYLEKFGFGGLIKNIINVVTEDNFNLINCNIIDFSKNTCFVGYWQNPKYFSQISSFICSELYPPKPTSLQAETLGIEMRESNSLAICLRLYEETISPESLSSTGKIKTLSNIRSVIDKLSCNIEDYKVYLFCTHIPEDIGILNLPCSVVYVTPDYGFTDAVESLWLIAQCRNHIIMNSTFYWWGAYLSTYTHSKHLSREIWCANNFLNPNCILDSWNSY